MIKIETMSGMDSEKIIDVLEKDKIEYTKMGPKFDINLDRSSAKASILLSHLHRIAKFEELNESEIIKKIDSILKENIKDDKEAEEMIKIIREDLKKIPSLSKASKKEFLKNIKSTFDDLMKYYK